MTPQIMSETPSSFVIIQGNRKKIQLLQDEDYSYQSGFHTKSTTVLFQKCQRCFCSNRCTKTKDYCVICKKSLCNKFKCWDKQHYSSDLLSEVEDDEMN